MTVLAHLEPLERALVAAAFPAMTAWWRETIVRFYESGRRQLVLRVGRRGGKSSTLCRVAVLEALYGQHAVPPGDVGVVAIISVSRDEAGQRLRTIRAILDVLRVKYHPIEGGIELDSKPVAFKVYTASIGGVAGFTSVCVICDEVARWKDADTGANPATEVLGSLRPTLAGQTHTKIFLSSSPLSIVDAHAVAFDAGETAFQCVAYAQTWVARPGLTEEETRSIEPDDRVWRREYAAIPQASALSAFDADQVDRAIGATVDDSFLKCAPIVLVDPSAGSSDSYTWAVARVRLQPEHARWMTRRVWVPGSGHVHVYEKDANERRVPNPAWRETTAMRVEFQHMHGIDQAARRGFTSDHVVSHIVKVFREYGAVAAHGDQFERYALQSAIGRFGVSYVPHTWTAPLKERAIERVRQWLRDGVLALPLHERLRREMHAFEERIAPSGALTFRGRQGSHDDFAMLILLCALVDLEMQLPGSPLAARAAKPLPRSLVA